MRAYLFCVLLIGTVACNKNNTPSKSTHKATESGTAKPVKESATVVVTADGKVVSPNKKNSSGTKASPVTNATAFSTIQKQNLMTRYKIIPPRVLNVPESLAQQNSKGSYYVLKNTFWYWKAADGYYHLDETYYK